MNHSDALVVLPTFNEIENLERVVTSVRELGHDAVVVDDNSPDGTGRLADELAAADPGVSVLHRPGKLGLGSAYVDAFLRGMENGYKLLVEMDADGSHLAEYLDPIIAGARDSGGMAIGSRYVPGGEVAGWSMARNVLSRGANIYCRSILGLRTHDCTSGYRCYTREVLDKVGLERVFSQGYSFQIEMVYRCTRLGYPVVEVPIRFEDRVAGKSKVSEGEVRKALGTVLRLRFRGWR